MGIFKRKYTFTEALEILSEDKKNKYTTIPFYNDGKEIEYMIVKRKSRKYRNEINELKEKNINNNKCISEISDDEIYRNIEYQATNYNSLEFKEN